MTVAITCRTRPGKISPPRLQRKAQKILRLLRKKRVELSLVLVGNREIRRLNARYRKKNRPTDVLAFQTNGLPSVGDRILGDVVISVEQAKKQAKEKGTALEVELETLLIHGILHLLGYDHERSEREAGIMHRLERKLQSALSRPRLGV
ncbi:MAG: rRNA maturation RNase YbeY [Deltaproteobacteria bacterium]|nr:rRNA maturation RNase YbeY [Deltaproteobacteria bacterium]